MVMQVLVRDSYLYFFNVWSRLHEKNKKNKTEERKDIISLLVQMYNTLHVIRKPHSTWA